MAYRRLPFAQYFINTSEDFNATRRSTVRVNYTAISYTAGALDKLLGLQREVNYEIHYEPERDVIQINFQRTIGFADWLVNFEFAGKYYDSIDFEGEPLQLRVHRGWGRMYRTVKNEVREKWSELHEAHPTAETEVVGW